MASVAASQQRMSTTLAGGLACGLIANVVQLPFWWTIPPAVPSAVFVSHLLGRLYVGLEEVGDGIWSVFFGPVHLGWLDERDYRIMDVKGRKRRR